MVTAVTSAVTSKDGDEMYLDAYKKFDNRVMIPYSKKDLKKGDLQWKCQKNLN